MTRSHQHLLLLAVFLVVLFGFTAYVTLRSTRSPGTREDPFPGTGEWARSVLADLTLEQKVSQLFVTSTTAEFMNVNDPQYLRLVDLVERFGVGGVMFLRSEPLEQVTLANDLQRRARIPLLISQDMEWGAGMRVEHATTFPRTMAIGASREPDFAYALGYTTAREARALGVHQVYAPVADVNNNPRNPVINVRSYGESPELVSAMVTAHVHGLQDGGIISTAKHFPGHGDTEVDSHVGLPVLPFSRSRLETVELVPFREAIDRGVMSIMTGHLSIPSMSDSLVPASLSPEVSTRLLREQLGFRGLIVTDALNMQGVTDQYGAGEAAVRALEAGADVLLMSTDEYAARDAVIRAVEEGRLSRETIDRAAMQVLRAKEWLGLDLGATVDPQKAREVVHAPPHRMLSESIARAGLTLLRNEAGLIPLSASIEDVLVISQAPGSDPAAGALFTNRIRSFLPNANVRRVVLDGRSTAADFDAVLDASASADAVIVASFAPVAAAGRNLTPAQVALTNRLIARDVPVALVSFGSPYVVMEVDLPDAYLVAYGASDAAQLAAAQGLTGQSPIAGRLPVTIPDRFGFGAGLDTRQESHRVGYPGEVGMAENLSLRIDSLIRASIDDRAFPAAAVSIGRAGVVPHLKGYGHFTYTTEEAVDAHTLFDVASLTKVIATTTAVMKLYEEGRIDLKAPVARYIPEFGANGKQAVTIEQLLTHSGGLPAFIPFHTLGMTSRSAVLDSILTQPLVYPPGSEQRYSDHGFVVLSLVVEAVTGQRFDTYVHEHILAPLGMTHSGFRGAVSAPEAPIVPTEVDRTFRRRLLRGEVHDETAWILGGISGNAGLFSTAADLTRFAFMMTNGGRIDGKQFLKPETIALFTTRVAEGTRNTRALGWDTRSTEGYSSAGQFFGPRSFGHTGYTGTSLWIDPDQGLFVILLTNRVYPTRENGKIGAVRARLADMAYQSIVGPPEPIIPRDPRRQGSGAAP
ncbi:MAG TPA: glycoside hydrolase family 3 N-terminal domain-containing protein [Rhodothermales bacterium]